MILEQRIRAVVAELAAEIWESTTLADPSHPFLQAKGISPHGMYQRQDSLVLPLYRVPALLPVPLQNILVNLLDVSPEGQECTLTFGIQIYSSGTVAMELGEQCLMTVFSQTKTLELSALTEHESRFFVELLAGASCVYLCAGWLEAATIHETTGMPAVGCLDLLDMPEIAMSLRKNLPDGVEIIVAGEDGVAAVVSRLIQARRVANLCRCCATFADAYLKHGEVWHEFKE